MKSLTLKLTLALASAAVFAPAVAAPPPGVCEVVICNKLERMTLSFSKMMKDQMGEVCTPALLGKEDAVAGKRLESSSRGLSITKASVTRVKSVGRCG